MSKASANVLIFVQMDIGVALIISASGLVMGKYLHGSSKLSPQKVIKMTLPVLAFGLVRGVLGHFNVGADEYGRHWSFFLNLAFVPYTLLVWNALPSPHLVPICCLLIMTSKPFLVLSFLLSFIFRLSVPSLCTFLFRLHISKESIILFWKQQGWNIFFNRYKCNFSWFLTKSL